MSGIIDPIQVYHHKTHLVRHNAFCEEHKIYIYVLIYAKPHQIYQLISVLDIYLNAIDVFSE